ncbi:DUF4386 domain-containing protein [Paenibacillus sp. ACRSA]|uniref:DUF4386 domain-containing protein n=1 Tax=Paenibacillus sp. ACRSA TaxID=2918211 RepID=UPI001EF7469C|nr:DUF4386 domain-containing protein [Paenibacillus sp. ACRSA]MCG7378745.1 DUF4386 domain-containing protein [Paenibacillus sp. ACRSA]
MKNGWEISPHRRIVALTMGLALLFMAVAAGFAYGYVHNQLLVQGNTEKTVQNLFLHNNLYTAEIVGWIIVWLCDIVVTCTCYLFFKKLNKKLAVICASLRLVYTLILGWAVMNLIFIIPLTSKNVHASREITVSHGEQIMSYLQNFQDIWSVGLIVFGGHLMVLGILVLKADVAPKWIAILLLLASVGYFVIHSLELVGPAVKNVTDIINRIMVIPMTVGELSFALWLIYRGSEKRTKSKPLANYSHS